jgi:hypothetical protein
MNMATNTQHADKTSEKKNREVRKRLTYLRRHASLLTFFGGLIISLALTARDRVRESVRDINEAVQHADDTLELERRSNANLHQLQLMTNVLIEARWQEQRYAAAVQQVLQSVSDSRLDAEASVANAERLLRILPEQNYNLTQKMAALRSDFLKISNALRADEGLAPSERIKHTVDFETHLRAISGQSQRLTDDILGSLESTRDKLGHIAALSSFATYAILTIGFAISLTGKVYGDEKDGEKNNEEPSLK